MKYYMKTILICINVVKNHQTNLFQSLHWYLRTNQTNEGNSLEVPELKAFLATNTIVLPLGTILKDTRPNLRRSHNPRMTVKLPSS